MDSEGPDRLFEADIDALQRAMSAGHTTARALIVDACARVVAYDGRGAALNAVVTLDATAEAQADALDRERGTQGPLHGIPVMVRDDIDAAGLPTSAGTLALASWHRDEEAPVVRRLRDAGAAILGKTAMHELAAGITGASPRTGPTRNACDPARVAGGSSSGSAVAVAASDVPLAIGTDTAGAIRIPASFGATVGLRGTAGLLPVEGTVPSSTTQDAVGPLARSVRDVAIGMDALLGLGAADARSMTAALDAETSGDVRIGVLRDWIGAAAEDGDVTDVLLTHLHIGHVGWCTVRDGEAWRPTFPHARYVMPRSGYAHFESDAGRADPNRGMFLDRLCPVVEAGQAEVVGPEGGAVGGGFTDHPTPGHGPDHCSIVLADGDEAAMFAGDVFHHPGQSRRPDRCSVSCADREAARRSRRRALSQAADRGLLVLTSHVAGSSAGRVLRAGDAFRWCPERRLRAPRTRLRPPPPEGFGMSFGDGAGSGRPPFSAGSAVLAPSARLRRRCAVGGLTEKLNVPIQDPPADRWTLALAAKLICRVWTLASEATGVGRAFSMGGAVPRRGSRLVKPPLGRQAA